MRGADAYQRPDSVLALIEHREPFGVLGDERHRAREYLDGSRVVAVVALAVRSY